VRPRNALPALALAVAGVIDVDRIAVEADVARKASAFLLAFGSAVMTGTQALERTLEESLGVALVRLDVVGGHRSLDAALSLAEGAKRVIAKLLLRSAAPTL
jgi:hypothetical protein